MIPAQLDAAFPPSLLWGALLDALLEAPIEQDFEVAPVAAVWEPPNLPIRWEVKLDDEVVASTVRAMTPAGLRTLSAHVRPLSQVPEPWRGGIRQAVADHQLRWSHFWDALDRGAEGQGAWFREWADA